MEVFKEVFKEKLPDLYEHFHNEKIPEEVWIHKWFMTGFLYNIPPGLCIRIWDNMLASGTHFFFNFTLSLLSLL